MSHLLSRLKRPTRTDNAPRYTATTGHYESWFIRANHPTEPKALWLKTTILHRHDGSAIAEAWCALFGIGERPTWVGKATVPVAEARFADSRVQAANCELELGQGTPLTGASATGAVHGQDALQASWKLRSTPAEGALATQMSLFPGRWMIDGPFPKNKLLTPAPSVLMTGEIRLGETRVNVDGWLGMQGHNWGQAHAFAYAWGHVVFPDAAGRPICVAEGFSGRIKVAGRATPHLSALTVRRGDRRWRFDRLIDLWSQSSQIGDMTWRLRMRGRDGEASIAMKAPPESVVCLGYENPDTSLAYCLNSKLSACVLRVNPIDGDAFELRTDHLAALEILTREPDDRYPVAA